LCDTCDVLHVLQNTIKTLKDAAEHFPSIIIMSVTTERRVNRLILTKLQVECEMLLRTIEMLKTHMDSVSIDSLHNISLMLQTFFEKQFLDYTDQAILLDELRELVFAFEDVLLTISHCDNSVDVLRCNTPVDHSFDSQTDLCRTAQCSVPVQQSSSRHDDSNTLITPITVDHPSLTLPLPLSNSFTTNHQGTHLTCLFQKTN
jgi:hypothetical protein